MLKKIISGAQTGVDIAALEVALQFGLQTGGTMPFGFKTLEGCKPEYVKIFGISAHHSSSYVPRTRQNVKDSDATLRLAFDLESSGEKCTLRAIKDLKKRHFDVDLNDPIPATKVAEWIDQEKIEILNIAGNSEKTSPGIHEVAKSYLAEVMQSLGFTRPDAPGVVANPCVRDTNGDGDCQRCHSVGCPLLVFCPSMIDKMKISDADAAKFRANAERFEYTEPWLGTIKGYRSKDGRVLLDHCEPA